MSINSTPNCLCVSCQCDVHKWYQTVYQRELNLLGQLVTLKHIQDLIISYLYHQGKHTIRYQHSYQSDIELCSGCFQYGLYLCLRTNDCLPFRAIDHDYFIQRHLYLDWVKQLKEGENLESPRNQNEKISRADDNKFRQGINKMSKYQIPQVYYCCYQRQHQPDIKRNQMIITSK